MPALFRVGMGVRLLTTGHTCGASRSATAKIPCQRYRPCVPWSNALNTIEEVEEVEEVAVLLVPAMPVVLVVLWEGSRAGRWIPCREEKPRNVSLVRDGMVMFEESTGRRDGGKAPPPLRPEA